MHNNNITQYWNCIIQKLHYIIAQLEATITINVSQSFHSHAHLAMLLLTSGGHLYLAAASYSCTVPDRIMLALYY